MQRPSKNVITLRYGATTDPYAPGNPHIGVDFSSLPDDKIYMPEDGVVQLVPDDGTCGRSIHIMVGNRHHALCHTSKYLVKDGQYCNQGKPIAIMGETGYAFGKHLHWALKIGGEFVDPIKQVTPIKPTKPQGVKLMLEEQPPVFNAKYYLNKNPDVNKKYNLLNAKNHWLESGIKEGRPSAPNFHVKEYLANYGDLQRVYGKTGYAKAVKHYYNNGINENRSGRTIKPDNKLVALKDKIINLVKGA